MLKTANSRSRFCPFYFFTLESWNWTHGIGLMELDSWNWTHGIGLMELNSWSWTHGVGVMELDSWNWTHGIGIIELDSWNIAKWSSLLCGPANGARAHFISPQFFFLERNKNTLTGRLGQEAKNCLHSNSLCVGKFTQWFFMCLPRAPETGREPPDFGQKNLGRSLCDGRKSLGDLDARLFRTLIRTHFRQAV